MSEKIIELNIHSPLYSDIIKQLKRFKNMSEKEAKKELINIFLCESARTVLKHHD